MNKKINGVCELEGKQEGGCYLIILTADNEGDSPQQLSWHVCVPPPLHGGGPITGEKLLHPHDRNNTEILLSKRLPDFSGNQARQAMSEPIPGSVSLGSKAATINTTWSELFKQLPARLRPRPGPSRTQRSPRPEWCRANACARPASVVADRRASIRGSRLQRVMALMTDCTSKVPDYSGANPNEVS